MRGSRKFSQGGTTFKPGVAHKILPLQNPYFGKSRGPDPLSPPPLDPPMDCTIHVVKTKALISFAVTVKLICVSVFAYAKIWFSHDTAHIVTVGRHYFSYSFSKT